MHWLRMPNSMQQQTYRRYLPIKQWHLQVKIFWKNQAEFLAIKVMNLIVSINFHHQDQKKITQHLNYLEDHLLNAFHLQRGKDLQKENKNCRNSINSSLLSKPIKMMSRKTRPQILRFQLSNHQILEVLVPIQKLPILAEVEMMVKIC